MINLELIDPGIRSMEDLKKDSDMDLICIWLNVFLQISKNGFDS